MPRLAINYEKAVIYKLCCKDVNITNIYIGSTTSFRQRKWQHKSRCSRENGKDYDVYVCIKNNGGWENWDMVEIEKVKCDDANELHSRERHYIETLKADLNKRNPMRTDEEHIAQQRIYIKEYRDTNKEKEKLRGKQYRDTNKNIILNYQNEYREINKDKIKQYLKTYRENNKEKKKEYNKQYNEAKQNLKLQTE